MMQDRPLGRSTVFLVEDDPLIGHVVAMLLEDAGATVLGPYTGVKSARDAIGILHGSSPDCAVLDCEIYQGKCEMVALSFNRLNVPIVFYTERWFGLSEQVPGVP